jgi:hypothetical protein
MAHVQVRRARIDPELDPEGSIGCLEKSGQVDLADDLGGATVQQPLELGWCRWSNGA